jgi:hypothetical protein
MKRLEFAVDTALCNPKIKTVVIIESPEKTIRITRRLKPRARATRTEFVLTIGKPNHSERKYIKMLQKAGEPFPVKKFRLKFYPKKRG